MLAHRLVLALMLVSPLAHAGHRKRADVEKKVDKALGVVKATPQQRAQVQAAVGELMRVVEEQLPATKGLSPQIEEALKLFEADRIEPSTLSAMKARRLERQGKLADALTQAFYDVHEALSHDQRQQVVDYETAQEQGSHMKTFKEKMKEQVIIGFVNAWLEDTLDTIHASDAERKAMYATRDRLVPVFQEARAARPALIDEVATMFRGDTLDKQTLATFRATQEQRLNGIIDAVQQSLLALHDALTPPHRQQIVARLRVIKSWGSGHLVESHPAGAY